MNEKHVDRAIFEEFKSKVRPQKILILSGARRVGKTEMIKKYLSELSPDDYHF